MEGNEEEIGHSPPTRWIACINIAFVPTTWLNPSLKDHPSPLGHDWELACRAVCHTRPTLPTQLPEPELSETVGKMKIMMTRKTVVCDDSSESSDVDSIDSTSDAEC